MCKGSRRTLVVECRKKGSDSCYRHGAIAEKIGQERVAIIPLEDSGQRPKSNVFESQNQKSLLFTRPEQRPLGSDSAHHLERRIGSPEYRKGRDIRVQFLKPSAVK